MCKLSIVSDHHAAHGAGDGFGFLSAEKSRLSKAPNGPPFVMRSEGMNAIFYDSDSVIPSDSQCLIEFSRDAESMLQNQHLGA
jgi:hypothetical protein